MEVPEQTPSLPIPEAEKKTPDTAPNPDTIKKGSEFSIFGFNVKVHQINLPRLTLDLVQHGRQCGQNWNPSSQGEVISFGGHKFYVKAATGKRLYLIMVEDDKEKETESDESVQ